MDLTFKEYRLLCKAYQLKQVDEDYRLHEQAFLNMAANARNKKGKLIYPKFSKFYNYKSELQKIEDSKVPVRSKSSNPQIEAYRQYLLMKKQKGGQNGSI